MELSMRVEHNRAFPCCVYTCIEEAYLLFYILAISAGKKRYKTANFKKIRHHYNQDTLREHIIPDESNRFRYFYHIRRANGDALSS
ncbi:unnamed protein product, partial [Rotaria socialis]